LARLNVAETLLDVEEDDPEPPDFVISM